MSGIVTVKDEERWVDAAIRWDDHAEEEVEDAPFDPFAEDRKQKFCFSFPLSITDDTTEQLLQVAGNSDGSASASASKSIVADPDNTIDVITIELFGYTHDSDETFNSTGLTLWRAAEHLCHYMIKTSSTLQKKRILELGCGLGLNGILAHKLLTEESSTSTVYLTDGDTDAMAQLRDNVKHNISQSCSSNIPIRCNQLIWGREKTTTFLEKHCDNNKFDVLLASDVVYVGEIIEPLIESVTVLLSNDGVFLFAYCSKRNVPVKVEMVLDAATTAGLMHECVEEVDGIMIYSFRWKVV